MITANVLIWGGVVALLFVLSAVNGARSKRARVGIVSGWVAYVAVAALFVLRAAADVGGWMQTAVLAGMSLVGALSVGWGLLVIRQGEATPAPARNFVPKMRPTWGRGRYTTASRTRYAGYKRATRRTGAT